MAFRGSYVPGQADIKLYCDWIHCNCFSEVKRRFSSYILNLKVVVLEVEIANCHVEHNALYVKRNMIFYYFNDLFLKFCWCYVMYNIHRKVYRSLVPVFGHLLVVTHLPSYFNTEKREKFPFQFCFYIYTGSCNILVFWFQRSYGVTQGSK